MLCSDTGGHEAIHIPREVVELATDLHKLITTIKDVADGEAEISMRVQPGGHIPSFRCFFNKSRKRKKSA
jgi:hypothetical protein